MYFHIFSYFSSSLIEPEKHKPEKPYVLNIILKHFFFHLRYLNIFFSLKNKMLLLLFINPQATLDLTFFFLLILCTLQWTTIELITSMNDFLRFLDLNPRSLPVVLRPRPRCQVMNPRPCLWDSLRWRVQLWWDRKCQGFVVTWCPPISAV